MITNLLNLGPMYAVIEARRKGRLGSLDPVLFSMTLSQSVVWVVYGIFATNIYYVLGSIFGVYLSIFYLLTSMQLGPSKSQYQKIEIFVLFWIGLIIIFSVIGLWLHNVAYQAAGLMSLLTSCSLYGVPFLNIRNILLTRDASSINRGFLSMQFLSGVMWTSYSYFNFDIYVLIPSLVSLLFGIIQLVLVIIFPRKKAPEETTESVLPQTTKEDCILPCSRPLLCSPSFESENQQELDLRPNADAPNGQLADGDVSDIRIITVPTPEEGHRDAEVPSSSKYENAFPPL